MNAYSELRTYIRSKSKRNNPLTDAEIREITDEATRRINTRFNQDNAVLIAANDVNDTLRYHDPLYCYASMQIYFTGIQDFDAATEWDNRFAAYADDINIHYHQTDKWGQGAPIQMLTSGQIAAEDS